MINQQLVDYIKQQMQAGVSKDAVRKALGDAGWAPADVDDSMRAAEPVGPAMAASAAAAQPTVNPVVAMGGTEAAKPAAAAASAAASPSSSEKFFSKSATATQPAASAYEDDDTHPSTRKFMVAMIAMGAVILLLAGALTFVYLNLNGQLDLAQEAGGGNPAQAAALQQQVNQLTTEKDGLATQVQTLTAENLAVMDEIKFFAAASGTSTAPVAATVQGMLSGNASSTFTLTTVRNVKILVANSKDAKVAAALTPLANSTSSVTLGGTHPPASPNLTVTSVNGAPL